MKGKGIACSLLVSALLATCLTATAGVLGEMGFDTFVNNDPGRCHLALKYLAANHMERFDAKDLCGFRARGYEGPSTDGIEHLDWSATDGGDSLTQAKKMYEANHTPAQLLAKESQEKEFLQFASIMSEKRSLLIRRARLDVDGKSYVVSTINSNYCSKDTNGWWSLPQAAIVDSNETPVSMQFPVAGQPMYVDGLPVLLAINGEDWQSAKDRKPPFIYGALLRIDIGLVAGRLMATPNTICSFNIYKESRHGRYQSHHSD